MNLYHVNKDIIRFNIFNLINDNVNIVGQFQIYYNLKTHNYLLRKRGDFGSLTYFPKSNNSLQFPTAQQKLFLKKYITKRLKTACYYDRDAINHKGLFLLKTMQTRENNGEYLSSYKQYFIWENDEYASNEQKQFDKQAIRILNT